MRNITQSLKFNSSETSTQTTIQYAFLGINSVSVSQKPKKKKEFN